MSSWETARKTRTLLSLFKPSKPAEAQDENAVRLDLDGNQLSYAQGRWRLGAACVPAWRPGGSIGNSLMRCVAGHAPMHCTDGTAAAKFEADMGLLQDEVTRLRSEMTEMQEKYKQAVEEKLVAEFKNQVLMELVSAGA